MKGSWITRGVWTTKHAQRSDICPTADLHCAALRAAPDGPAYTCEASGLSLAQSVGRASCPTAHPDGSAARTAGRPVHFVGAALSGCKPDLRPASFVSFALRVLGHLRVLVGPNARHSPTAYLLVAALLLLAPAPAFAHDEPPVTPAPAGEFSTRDVGFDPHLDAQLPLDLAFHDETGRAVRLGDYVKDRPVVLSLNDFTCQDLCPLELQNLVDTMDQVPFRLGSEYSALAISINPANTAQDAATLRGEVVRRYARPDAPNGADAWHFLTGDQAAITQLAQAVGFRYAYDPLAKDYAHPVGAILLTPGGRIARYLYGMDFPPNDMRLAIAEAAQGKISTPVEAVLLLCYHYDVATGRYSNVALGAVRAGGILTILGLGTFLAVMWGREWRGRGKRRPSAPGPAAGEGVE